jgi:MFS family permease
VSALGNGAWYASRALFLIRSVELPAAHAGLALTAAGVAGIAAATPLGHLADRLGPREVLIALSVVRALSMAGFLLVEGLGGLIVVASLMTAAQQGAAGVRGAHIAGELLFVAASWGLSVPLMPDDRAGQYQGVVATGQAAAQTAAPLLMTAVVVGWGQAGWLALGALFVAATLPAPAITRRALRARAPGAAAAAPHPAPAPAPARSA